MLKFQQKLLDIDFCSLKNTDVSLLGMDVGDKTIGIAVSDKSFIIASPIKTIMRKSPQADIAEVLKIINHYNVKIVIYGWPLHMSGEISDQCRKIESFVQLLNESICEVEFFKWDERFSTKAVEKIMLTADISRKKRQKNVDKSAATYILQGAIDLLNNSCVKYPC